ncbi:MCE family protein, partial [Nocardioides sp. CER28]
MKRLLALLAAVCLSLTACDFDVYDLPLPGGADTGSDPMTLHVEFADVLDLVPDSAVKVDEVSVGKVTSVKLVDGHADVTVEVRRDTKLPADATAEIRQTSLLGEKFVSLVAPASDPSPALMKSGDTIPLARSGRNPEIEEVLGALSLILNGGGVAQLKTISTELNKALAGHEDSARSVLTQVEVLMKNLDDNKASIVQALESINRLSKSVRSQESTIDATLGELPSALKSIDAQRKDLVTMLQALSRLGDVGVRVINASKTATIQVVHNLEPTLTQLADAGDSLVKSLNTALTYPFVDEVVGRDPQVARNLHMGDYVNLSIDLQVDLGGPLEAAASGSVLPSDLDPTK